MMVEAKSGELVWKYFADRKIITRFAILCGDAIHCLSAALDFAWYELTRADSPEPLHRIRFPVYPTRKHLEDFIESREKQQSIVRLGGTLLDSIRPYKGSHGIGDSLYALHQLDLRDKHRLLIPQVQVSHVWQASANDRTIDGEDVPVIYGPDLINTYGAKDQYQGELSASIIFGEGAFPVEGKPVRETLRGFQTAVEVALLFLRPDRS